MKIYVVSKTIGGYAREDADEVFIVAAFTDEAKAKIVKACSGSASITEIEVDVIPKGVAEYAAALGYKL